MRAPDDFLYQLAGITGLGWTVLILGYLGTVIGYGDDLVIPIVREPQLLLYLGIILFVITFGLDQLRGTRPNEER
jgi:hypothetical protein